jgi:hypothetical protein
MSLFTSPRRDAVAGLLAAAALALVLAPAAWAADCDGQVTEQPFAPWADLAGYVLVSNGTVETGAHWNLEGGAARSAGNEPFYVHDEDDSTSLALPAGSSATTAPVCVGLDYPTMRLFARNKGSLLSTLAVEVLFQDAGGKQHALPIGAYSATSAWQPTTPLAVVANSFALSGDTVDVAFRFTPLDALGKWAIDDVYVDPFRRG